MISGFVDMENELFAKCVVSLINLVEHSCNVSVLGKLRDDGAACWLVKDNRYMSEDEHLVAITI